MLVSLEGPDDCGQLSVRDSNNVRATGTDCCGAI